MKSTRWLVTYIFMASVGLWFAFFVSLKFISRAHSQTPPPPTAGDLPPEFTQDSAAPEAPANTTAAPGRIPPPPVGTPAQEPAQSVDGQQAPKVAAPGAPVNPEFPLDEEYTYEPGNRRDPFKPYRNFRPGPAAGSGAAVNRADLSDPLQRWDVNRFAVMAIIWEVRSPKAMIKDPDGTTYMIAKNTKIGRNGGYVVAIREGEVVVVETVDNEGVVTKEVRILELKK